jgi:putative ABC transport system permease protein
MRLAWHNIASDWTRFVVTVLGIAAAVFLMQFQGSTLIGFLRAASKIIDATDSDIWIVARGVSCFEFPAPIERRVVEIAHSVVGVESAAPICTRLVEFRKPDGSHQAVVLIGADPNAGARFPTPHLTLHSRALEPEGLLVDRSNLKLLDITRLPLEVEINERRARVVGETSGFSSFLGSPYVFASYEDGAEYIDLPSNETTFVILRLRPEANAAKVKEALRTRLRNVDVYTRAEFSRKARAYWISQTGAGGAILVAAMLGFFVGLAIVSQSIYAATMENIEEFATLKAMGASNWLVIGVVMSEALICGAAGYILGVAAAIPLERAAAVSIPWLATPWWIPMAAILPTLAMCILASLISVRKALGVEPGRVFRA